LAPLYDTTNLTTTRAAMFSQTAPGHSRRILGDSQPESETGQNAGLRSDLSYVKGVHNIKVGARFSTLF